MPNNQDTMICVSEEKIYDAEYDMRRVVIMADSKPSTMPTTGEGISYLRDSAHIAPGSILLVLATSEKYIMNTANEWIKWEA